MLIKVMAKNNKMNKKVSYSTKKVELPQRVEAEVDGTAAFNWFPGHMMKALRDIKSKVGMVDLVVEIRDARLPLASSNSTLDAAIGGKSRLILLNKANLADSQQNLAWSTWFDEQNADYLFINCLERPSLKQVLSKAKSIIERKRKQCNGDDLADKEKYKFMIIGLPNTGKSTFINSVANRNAAKVANKPGQTQVQQWVKVDDEMDLLDTPGVMPAQLEKEEHKIWLSIINAIPDHVVGEEDPACFLINYLLKNKVAEFFERYKFETQDVDLQAAIHHIAKVRGCLKQKGMIDLDRVYKLVLMDFREGLIGKVTLEHPPRN